MFVGGVGGGRREHEDGGHVRPFDLQLGVGRRGVGVQDLAALQGLTRRAHGVSAVTGALGGVGMRRRLAFPTCTAGATSGRVGMDAALFGFARLGAAASAAVESSLLALEVARRGGSGGGHVEVIVEGREAIFLWGDVGQGLHLG